MDARIKADNIDEYFYVLAGIVQLEDSPLLDELIELYQEDIPAGVMYGDEGTVSEWIWDKVFADTEDEVVFELTKAPKGCFFSPCIMCGLRYDRAYIVSGKFDEWQHCIGVVCKECGDAIR